MAGAGEAELQVQVGTLAVEMQDAPDKAGVVTDKARGKARGRKRRGTGL